MILFSFSMINEMKTRIKTVFNNYKEHLIWTSVAKDPRTNRWKFFSQVLWSDVGEFKSFPSQLSYHTEAEAKLEALSLAKLWIDAGKPAIV
jgi:hypothetical protein